MKPQSTLKTIIISLVTFIATAILTWLGSALADSFKPGFVVTIFGGVPKAEFEKLQQSVNSLSTSTVRYEDNVAIHSVDSKIRVITAAGPFAGERSTFPLMAADDRQVAAQQWVLRKVK
jgi:hypothetical protein